MGGKEEAEIVLHHTALTVPVINFMVETLSLHVLNKLFLMSCSTAGCHFRQRTKQTHPVQLDCRTVENAPRAVAPPMMDLYID